MYSADVSASILYYTEKLEFDNSWDWGKPATFGGVSRNGIEIFFCEKGQGNPGTWISVFVDNVDELYESIKTKGAKILSVPQTMEWGVREMLVEDPDGHKIRFGQNVHVSAGQEHTMLPSTIKITQRKPTAKEYINLLSSVGWSLPLNAAMEQKLLEAAVFAVVAEDSVSGEAVGCALLLGDNASFYYVKDVMVHHAWQCKGIGTALMQELTDWLDTNGVEKALVGLYTGDSLAPFYGKFGFAPAFGMSRRISRNKK